MEVEREFMDAFSIIVTSGYFLEQEDFLNLVSLLQVSYQSEHVVERAKLLEFFQLAAELLNFDTCLVNDYLSAPWEEEGTVGHQTEMNWTQNANMFNQTSNVKRRFEMKMEMENDELLMDRTFDTHESLYSVVQKPTTTMSIEEVESQALLQ